MLNHKLQARVLKPMYLPMKKCERSPARTTLAFCCKNDITNGSYIKK